MEQKVNRLWRKYAALSNQSQNNAQYRRFWRKCEALIQASKKLQVKPSGQHSITRLSIETAYDLLPQKKYGITKKASSKIYQAISWAIDIISGFMPISAISSGMLVVLISPYYFPAYFAFFNIIFTCIHLCFYDKPSFSSPKLK